MGNSQSYFSIKCTWEAKSIRKQGVQYYRDHFVPDRQSGTSDLVYRWPYGTEVQGSGVSILQRN